MDGNGTESSNKSGRATAKEEEGNNDIEEQESLGDVLSSAGLFNVETTPAFKALEYLRTRRDTPMEKINELKGRLFSLHEVLLKSFEAEKTLLRKLTTFNGEISSQKLEMDKAQNRQFQENVEIGELKRELTKAENELKLSKVREEQLHKEIEECTKIRDDLNDDINTIRKHQVDILEPQLIASIKELKLDVLQRKGQLDNLRKDYDERQSQCQSVVNDKNLLDIEKEKQITQYSKASELPAKLQKQSEVFKEGITLLSLEATKQANLVIQLDREQERLTKRKHELDEFSMSLRTDYERRRIEMNQIERESEQIYKEHQLAKEQLLMQKEDKVRLDVAHKKFITEIKHSHDLYLRTVRDKEGLLKAYRRLESVLSHIYQSIPVIKEQRNDIIIQVETAKRDSKFHRARLNDIRKDIDLAIHAFLQYEQIEKADKEKLLEALAITAEYEKNLSENVAKYQELAHEAEHRAMERELRARDLLRLQTKLKKVQEDVKLKSVAVEDAHKKYSEMANRSKEMSALYEALKSEKNKYVNLIQSSKQRTLEMQDKLKILNSEVEILRNELQQKDKELAKRKQERGSSTAQRDFMRQETNKHLLRYRELRDSVEQNLSAIETIQLKIENVELFIASICGQYQSTIEQRNYNATQVIERNDELCLLHERSNLQEDLIRKAELELQKRDSEISFLTVAKKDLERDTEIQRKALDSNYKSKGELEYLKQELLQYQEISAYLGKKAEDPFFEEGDHKFLNTHRSNKRVVQDVIRLVSLQRRTDLAGSDPSPENLLHRIEELSIKLAKREETLLEKELILHEVASLSSRLEDQLQCTREEVRANNQQANDFNKKIKAVTRQMMSKVSELAMVQATAMKLLQEKTSKKEFLLSLQQGKQDAYVEWEQEYRKKQTILEQRIKESRDREVELARAIGAFGIDPSTISVSSEYGVNSTIFYSLPNGARTTAVPRPNAYLPDSKSFNEEFDGSRIQELPLPKPYGLFAPVKPSEVSIMLLKSTKKPTINEVQI